MPLFIEAGVDLLWPLERAFRPDPVRLRSSFSESLRLLGRHGRRILAEGPRPSMPLRAILPLI